MVFLPASPGFLLLSVADAGRQESSPVALGIEEEATVFLRLHRGAPKSGKLMWRAFSSNGGKFFNKDLFSRKFNKWGKSVFGRARGGGVTVIGWAIYQPSPFSSPPSSLVVTLLLLTYPLFINPPKA